MAEPLSARTFDLPRRRTRASAVVVALRPRQWTKNLLLFAGIVFAAELGDGGRWLEAVAAFVAYCAASSAAYLVNDVRDAAADRLHPVKRMRPVASGRVSPGVALCAAAGLALVAVAIAAVLGAATLACLLAFLALQGAYSLWLKSVELVDVLAIAVLFVLRAAAGAIAVDVRISPWLLVCTFLLALFLGLAKRRAELRLDVDARPALAGYSADVLDRLLTIVALVTVVVYTAYTIVAYDSLLLVATVPLVGFGLVRYLRLLRAEGVGEEPEAVLVTDLPILLTVAVWAAACAVAIAFG
ncbi:MAG TPA: UbiA family prenyltransferase [Gaiella sp.]|nr:UbiA family prenyltransferase [Gaiella sp.]